jgi:DNA-binding NtrC family response regulator
VIGTVDLSGQGLVRAALEAMGRASERLPTPSAAHLALAQRALDALILETALVGEEARALLRAAQAHGVPLLVVARDARVATAVDALQQGASDYLAAPFELESLQRALERLDAVRLSAPARFAPPAHARFGAPASTHFGAPAIAEESPFVTRDPETLSLLELLRSVAPSDATVLIEGESGTGKELLARLVHGSSPRRARELITLNCAALPAGLLESELFGHERGSFTGALSRSIGKFELAHGSTILLDEIGELELGLQAKLLRVLQEKEVQRIGARRPVAVDFRLVATTNRELREEVRAGRFREDLFYRLCVLPIRIRPLRERRGDVPLLVDHFLRRAARAGRALPVLSAQTRAALEQHAWPGNVRELENAIERLILTHAGQLVTPAALGFAAPHASPASPGPAVGSAPPAGAGALPAGAGALPAGAGALPFTTLREMERWLIAQTLRRTRGNRTQSARELGISLRTLRNKIREFAIVEPDTLPRTGLGRFEPAPAGVAQPLRREATLETGAFRERAWHAGCSDGSETAREV